MQFSQVKIENLFTYYGENIFNFNDSEQPISLIIGENGFGKTSFINSIKIALHGITKDLLSIGDFTLSKQDYILGNKEKNFSGIINRVSKREGNKIAKITIKIDDGDTFFLERKIKALANNYLESVTIYDNEKNIILEGDEAQDFINSKISPTLAKFFFFDGEKIQTIADFSKHEFKQMLEDVLELDIYDQIISDSEKLIRKINKENVDKKFQKTITKKEEELDSILSEITSINDHIVLHKEKMKTLMSEEKDLDNKLKKLKSQYKEPLLEARRNLLLNKEQLFDYQDKFKKLCLYSLPLYLNKTLSKKVNEDVNNNYKGKISISKNIIDIKRKEFLNLIDDNIKSNIETIFDKVFITNIESQTVEFADPTKIEIQHKNIEKIRINDLIEKIGSLKDKIKHLNNEILDYEIKQENDHKEYELDFKKLRELSELIGIEKGRIEEYQSRVISLYDSEKLIKQEIAKISIQDHKNEIAIKKINTLESTIKISIKMKDKIKKDKREMLESSINTKFKLLRKKGYDADFIKVDENFNINIFDTEMNAMDILSSSSGQKQIIATALIWGISEYISEDIPMIIDTPLGRLDDRNQSLILTEFYPNASNQVLILPTPSELRNEGFDLLKTEISQVFTLSNSGSATNIIETSTHDYFERRNI